MEKVAEFAVAFLPAVPHTIEDIVIVLSRHESFRVGHAHLFQDHAFRTTDILRTE